MVSFRQKRAGVSKEWTEVLKTRLSSGLYTHVYKHGFAVFFLREKQGAIVKALQEFVLL